MKRVLLLFAIAANVRAATILIAPDNVVIDESRAVVVATAESSRARWSASGWIETVTTMRVDESIKGSLRMGATFELVELGGVVDHIGMHVSGSPHFVDGERALLLLDKNERGEWIAKDLAAGVFRLRGELALRTDLCTSQEPVRLAEQFLRYVRETARGIHSTIDYCVIPSEVEGSGGEGGAPHDRPDPSTPLGMTGIQTTDATPTITSYLATESGDGGTLGSRWRSFSSTVIFLSRGSQPNALGGGITALQRGIAVWNNDGASNVAYAYGGTTSRTFAFSGTDGVNSIQFNDPDSEIPGSYPTSRTLAVTQWWFDTRASTTHVFNGERFCTTMSASRIV